SYDPVPILEANRREDVIDDLSRLGDERTSIGYEKWVRGLLELAPLLRDGPYAGVMAPRTVAETAKAKRALAALSHARLRVPAMQTVEVYRAMAALAACDLKVAEAALASARVESGGEERRETLLVGQELLLRQGKEGEVRAFLDWALSQPGVSEDPYLSRWLPAIQRDLERGVRCPALGAEVTGTD
ncbi:MAG: hypothetical protein KC416_17415, partial [Myxococcales bacterium]|nr:hypothetical protein [Myxococcales bacterium]